MVKWFYISLFPHKKRLNWIRMHLEILEWMLPLVKLSNESGSFNYWGYLIWQPSFKLSNFFLTAYLHCVRRVQRHTQCKNVWEPLIYDTGWIQNLVKCNHWLRRMTTMKVSNTGYGKNGSSIKFEDSKGFVDKLLSWRCMLLSHPLYKLLNKTTSLIYIKKSWQE